MNYPLASSYWDEDELTAIQNVINSDMYTMGTYVKQFEQAFANEMNIKHAIMVNSGSSANLLMLNSLKVKYNWKNANIIVPAVAWSTTYYPIEQIGAKLNFVDIDRDTMNIDPNKVIESIDSNTKAIMAVNLLGNPADLNALRQIANDYNLILLEDNCESFGATLNNKFMGTFGDIGTYSFFFSHHLQTMEGGMVVTNDDDIANIIRSSRAHGWIRDLPNDNRWYNKKGDKFKEPFIFAIPGYSVRPLEMSGAIGLSQLNKWKKNVNQRIENWNVFKTIFSKLDCKIQKQISGAISSWYGFSILIKNRDYIVKELMDDGIQLRPIMTGNMLRQPVMKYFNDPIIPKEGCPNADYIDDNGFFLGNHPYDISNDLEQISQKIQRLVS